MKPLPIPQLGLQVFIITDNNLTFLSWLRAAISLLPAASEKFFTLHHCCPPIYWEHAGGPNQAARQEAIDIWEAEESALERSKRYFDLVGALLQGCGVPADHIHTHLTVEEDDPIKAVIAELERGQYSGVIVSGYHHDLIRRLHGRGLADHFRHVPKVEVWALDEDVLGLVQPT